MNDGLNGNMQGINKMLHFRTPCMCGMYKNATLFNIALEPLYISIKEYKDSVLCALPNYTIGQRIRKLRLSLGLTQEEFATIIGNKNSTVANWENGPKVPLPKTQDKIIETFNLPKDYLL